jgi:acetyltransferase-like isoleucine patch superfamily enzyme
MSRNGRSPERRVEAVHGRRTAAYDADFELGLVAALRENYSIEGLVELYGRFATGEGVIDALMRKVIVNAGAKRCGPGLKVESGARFKHLETLEFDAGVFIGADAYIQGRYDGTCVFGKHVWIGPKAYFDARDLFIGDYVGWGPGAKVLGSEHTAMPTNVPTIETDLVIRPVRIEAWADIGINAVIMPGVSVGQGAIVGAGAVVTSDVAPFSIVAGVPARFLRWRKDEEVQDALSAKGDRV